MIRILLIIFALINGGYMLADGIYVLINGKFIGPEKPGPWALVFERLDVNVFRLGPMFVLFGVVWLAFAAGLFTEKVWAIYLGAAISILTIWYFPIGTLLSVAVIVLIFLK